MTDLANLAQLGVPVTWKYARLLANNKKSNSSSTYLTYLKYFIIIQWGCAESPELRLRIFRGFARF